VPLVLPRGFRLRALRCPGKRGQELLRHGNLCSDDDVPHDSRLGQRRQLVPIHASYGSSPTRSSSIAS
jgi:hypothetical protein